MFFWVSVQGFPNDLNLSIEIAIEIVFLLDVFLRFCLRSYSKNNNNIYFINIFYEFDDNGILLSHLIRDTCILIGAFPIETLISIIGYFQFLDINDNDLYSYLLFIKLFRFLDLLITKNKIQNLLNNLNFNFVIFYRFFNTIIILLLTTHVAACFWLFVNKAESNDSNFYYIYKEKFNNLSDQYILALEWAVSSMTGSCFGDVVPTTKIEIFASVIIMIIGSTFYCQIFADFETIIYITRFEKLEKKLI